MLTVIQAGYLIYDSVKCLFVHAIKLLNFLNDRMVE